VARKVTFTYLCKIENQKLSFGEFPSDELIVRLARALNADPDELLSWPRKSPTQSASESFTARRVPPAVRPG
jgi:transcriptional regulator with XRE-family HTH domain